MKSQLWTLPFGVFVKHRSDRDLLADCIHLIPKDIERSATQLHSKLHDMPPWTPCVGFIQIATCVKFLSLVSNFLEQGRAHFQRARPCAELAFNYMRELRKSLDSTFWYREISVKSIISAPKIEIDNKWGFCVNVTLGLVSLMCEFGYQARKIEE